MRRRKENVKTDLGAENKIKGVEKKREKEKKRKEKLIGFGL
jgi:hypothetical protein